MISGILLGALAALAPDAANAQGASPMVSPVEAHVLVISDYGQRLDPLTERSAMHLGRDYRAPVGAPVRAAATGVVTFAGRHGAYGLTVKIDHGDGLSTVYAHLSRILVAAGAHAPRGGLIGAVGTTGRSSFPHLHFEVRKNGEAEDPADYVAEVRPAR